MKTIYKYTLRVSDKFVVQLPKDHSILHLCLQDNTPTIWVLVDTESPLVDVSFRCFGTGFECNLPPTSYIGTILTDGGYVWHYFLNGDSNE